MSIDSFHSIISRVQQTFASFVSCRKTPRTWTIVVGSQDANNIRILFAIPIRARLASLHHTLRHFLNPTSTMSTSQPEGRREDMLAKQRLQMKEDFERQKATLISETEKSRPSSNRFTSQNDSMEDTLKHSTVGLVHLEEFQQKRKALEEAKAREAARTSELK